MGCLTLPVVTPPLPDVVEEIEKWAYLVVVCPLMHHREAAQQTVKRDERQLSQVELMDLTEELLPCADIHRRPFLCVELIQCTVAVKRPVESH